MRIIEIQNLAINQETWLLPLLPAEVLQSGLGPQHKKGTEEPMRMHRELEHLSCGDSLRAGGVRPGGEKASGRTHGVLAAPR